EGITASGVLSWESQPQQGLQDQRIRELIVHDEALNSIYLFLRTSDRRPYTYLGRLKYLTHDATRERPVHFQWQILDWDLDRLPLKRMNLTLSPEPSPNERGGVSTRGLIQTEPPAPTNRIGVSTPTFQTRRVPDCSTIEKQNRVLGRGGETMVIDYEKEFLR